MEKKEFKPYASAEEVYRAASFYILKKTTIQETRDDFPAYAVEVFLNRGTSLNLHSVYVDFCREKLGRSGQKMALASALPVSGLPGSVVDALEAQSRTDENDCYRDCVAELDSLSGDERTAAILTYLWEFTGSEIGFVLGVTESRVSQILKGTKKSLISLRGKKMRLASAMQRAKADGRRKKRSGV